jgi:hypothetical protein
MKLYFLEPEVAGGHGYKTIYGNELDIEIYGKSCEVKYLHYEFDGWLGDELLESTPCFIISKKLDKELEQNKFKDYRLEDCLITVSDQFRELYPNKKLPSFTRLIPTGTVEKTGEYFKNWSGHHFSISPKGELVVTADVLAFFKKSLKFYDITILKEA